MEREDKNQNDDIETNILNTATRDDFMIAKDIGDKGDIGGGQFGKVLAVRCTKEELDQKKVYALKIIYPSVTENTASQSRISNELGIMSSLEAHKNIVRYWIQFRASIGQFLSYLPESHQKSATRTTRSGKVKDRIFQFILFEYCHKTLDSIYLPPLETFKSYAIDLLSGICFLQKHFIAHRDLKLSNLFLTSTRLVIGDLGLAIQLPSTMRLGYHPDIQLFGNRAHQPPELFNRVEKNRSNPGKIRDLDFSKSDVWAAGVLLYEIALGEHPLEDYPDGFMTSRDRTIRYILDDIDELPKEYISDPVLSIVLPRMLQPEASNRISAQEALQILTKNRGLQSIEVIKGTKEQEQEQEQEQQEEKQKNEQFEQPKKEKESSPKSAKSDRACWIFPSSDDNICTWSECKENMFLDVRSANKTDQVQGRGYCVSHMRQLFCYDAEAPFLKTFRNPNRLDTYCSLISIGMPDGIDMSFGTLQGLTVYICSTLLEILPKIKIQTGEEIYNFGVLTSKSVSQVVRENDVQKMLHSICLCLYQRECLHFQCDCLVQEVCPIFILRLWWGTEAMSNIFDDLLVSKNFIIRSWALKALWRWWYLVHVLPKCKRYKMVHDCQDKKIKSLKNNPFVSAVKKACHYRVLNSTLFDTLLQCLTGNVSLEDNFSMFPQEKKTEPVSPVPAIRNIKKKHRKGSSRFLPLASSNSGELEGIDLFRSVSSNPILLPIITRILLRTRLTFRETCLTNLYSMLLGKTNFIEPADLVSINPDWQLDFILLLLDVPVVPKSKRLLTSNLSSRGSYSSRTTGRGSAIVSRTESDLDLTSCLLKDNAPASPKARNRYSQADLSAAVNVRNVIEKYIAEVHRSACFSWKPTAFTAMFYHTLTSIRRFCRGWNRTSVRLASGILKSFIRRILKQGMGVMTGIKNSPGNDIWQNVMIVINIVTQFIFFTGYDDRITGPAKPDMFMDLATLIERKQLHFPRKLKGEKVKINTESKESDENAKKKFLMTLIKCPVQNFSKCPPLEKAVHQRKLLRFEWESTYEGYVYVHADVINNKVHLIDLTLLNAVLQLLGGLGAKGIASFDKSLFPGASKEEMTAVKRACKTFDLLSSSMEKLSAMEGLAAGKKTNSGFEPSREFLDRVSGITDFFNSGKQKKAVTRMGEAMLLYSPHSLNILYESVLIKDEKEHFFRLTPRRLWWQKGKTWNRKANSEILYLDTIITLYPIAGQQTTKGGKSQRSPKSPKSSKSPLSSLHRIDIKSSERSFVIGTADEGIIQKWLEFLILLVQRWQMVTGCVGKSGRMGGGLMGLGDQVNRRTAEASVDFFHIATKGTCSLSGTRSRCVSGIAPEFELETKSTSCPGCKTKFSAFSRKKKNRRHCEGCGRVFCEKCVDQVPTTKRSQESLNSRESSSTLSRDSMRQSGMRQSSGQGSPKIIDVITLCQQCAKTATGDDFTTQFEAMQLIQPFTGLAAQGGSFIDV